MSYVTRLLQFFCIVFNKKVNKNLPFCFYKKVRREGQTTQKDLLSIIALNLVC